MSSHPSGPTIGQVQVYSTRSDCTSHILSAAYPCHPQCANKGRLVNPPPFSSNLNVNAEVLLSSRLSGGVTVSRISADQFHSHSVSEYQVKAMRTANVLATCTALLGLSSLVQAQSSASSSSSKKTRAAANTVDPTVAFLQSLQQAQISSMNCLITLVNMTAQPVGSCLGIAELATILYTVEGNEGAASATSATSKSSSNEKRQSADPEMPASAPASGSASGGGATGRGRAGNTTLTGFAGNIETWLGTVCKGTDCVATELEEGRAELASKCASQMKAEGGFVPMLDAMMANYAARYKTLACSVHLYVDSWLYIATEEEVHALGGREVE